MSSATYVVEVASSARSTCRGCKEGIEEGVLRFGSRTTSGDHPSTAWRHIQCISGRIANNCIAACGGATGVVGFSALSDDFKTSLVDHFASVTGDKEEKPAAKAPAAPKTKAKASDKKAEPAAKKAKKK